MDTFFDFIFLENIEIIALTSVDFSYLVGQPPAAITSDDPQWAAALPLDRRSAAHAPGAAGGVFSYGDYFSAATRFLSRAEMELFVRAAAVLIPKRISPADITHVAVHLAKHGAFYHPARVVATLDGDRLALVLNVAVSEAGRSALAGEYAALERLASRSSGFLPRVFGQGAARAGGCDLALFAAEWFEGYCELHLRADSGGMPHWQVWGEHGDRRVLSGAQIADFYRRCARILTACFNPLTFESVLGWHHAAGDFIVRPEPDRLSVRLITVRRYAPLFAVDADGALDAERLLDGLAAFFIDMSLRMRIDRLEGVGELIWAPPMVLRPVWTGFAEGLEIMTAAHDLPPELGMMARRYLAAHPLRVLEELGRRIAARYPRASGERRLMAQHLEEHLHALADVMAGDPSG